MTLVDCLRPGGLELTDRLVAAAALPPGAAVLDVGCGAGATVALLEDDHGFHAIGLDASGDQVRRAREARPDLVFTPGRAEALPYPDASFDGVLCECVLSTVDDAGAVMAEIGRVAEAARRGHAERPVRPRGERHGARRRDAESRTPRGGRGASRRRRPRPRGLGGSVRGAGPLSLGPRRLGGAPSSRAGAAERFRRGRRLGYFICVARQSGRARKGAS